MANVTWINTGDWGNCDVSSQDRVEATFYVQSHRPTVSDIRKLNRETLLPWTVPLLLAILDTEKSLAEVANWTVDCILGEFDCGGVMAIDLRFALLHPAHQKAGK